MKIKEKPLTPVKTPTKVPKKDPSKIDIPEPKILPKPQA